MPISDIMTRRLYTVSMETTIAEANRLFEETKVHHLIVAEGKSLKGIISDRDVLRCLSPYVGTAAESERDTYTLNKKAHQIMTRKPITLSGDSSIKKAAAVILDEQVSCLPIVDENNQLEGIVTWRDIFRFILKRD